MYAPLSFLLAALIASLTAVSYAELSSRCPRSAGEAAYVQEAFVVRWLSAGTGWAVVLIGIVSSATIVRGFLGYLDWFVHVPGWLAIAVLLLLLTVIAVWGIAQSLWIIAIGTVLEIGGLLLAVGVNIDAFTNLPEQWADLFVATDMAVWPGIVLAAFLAFYAFVGFEDMVNIAEEVTDARRTLPRAIILALIISTLLYVLVAVVAVLTLPISQLGASKAPLSDLVAAKSAGLAHIISLISLTAIINGAMAQIIMASRVVYGMGQQGLAPRVLAVVHPRTQTPVLATVLVTGLILLLALGLPLVRLAEITSFVTLFVFALMHGSLWRLKLSSPAPIGTVQYPIWVPVAGILSILLLVIYHAYHSSI